MKKGWFLVGIIFLLVPWLMVGCGVSEEVYNAVLAERDAAQTQVTNLQSEVSAIQVKYDDLKADYDEVKANFDELKADYDELNIDYEATSEELAEIKMVHPPRNFSSMQELKAWLLSNDVSERPDSEYAEGWYIKALELQEQALKDGYIISAIIEYYLEEEIFYVWNQAVIDGNVWNWEPESDELFDFSGWSSLLKVQ